MSNFIGLVFATLKNEGIDTSGMSTDEAIKKYNELQQKSGGKSGEKEPTPAENRKMGAGNNGDDGDSDEPKGTPAEEKRMKEMGFSEKNSVKSKYENAMKKLSGSKYEDGTYDLDTLKPISYDSGYQVTFSQIGDNYSDEEYAEKVNEFLKYSSDKRVAAGKFEGSPEISFHVENLGIAKQLAKKYNQISVWDWKNSSEIKTGGTGNHTEIDYENVDYPKGTSKEYTMKVNKKYEEALPVIEKLGLRAEDFKGGASKEGGYEGNEREIMDKYVFEPFYKKYPNGNNEAWTKYYEPIYNAIDAVFDKNYNDYYIKNRPNEKK